MSSKTLATIRRGWLTANRPLFDAGLSITHSVASGFELQKTAGGIGDVWPYGKMKASRRTCRTGIRQPLAKRFEIVRRIVVDTVVQRRLRQSATLQLRGRHTAAQHQDRYEQSCGMPHSTKQCLHGFPQDFENGFCAPLRSIPSPEGRFRWRSVKRRAIVTNCV